MFARRRPVPPESIAVRSFAVAILVGALLLMLPVCSADGRATGALTALFTATSATCVTGLTVVETGTHFSAVGQMVILALIQVGGIGIMTLATVLLLAVGNRVNVQAELLCRDSFRAESGTGVRAILAHTIAFTLGFELAGAALLAWRLHAVHGYALSAALYNAVFHAVSAFCNAGFGLRPDSLVAFHGDPVFLAVIMTLVLAGGIGFVVLYDLATIRFWRRDRIARGRLSLHSRIALYASLALILVGWLGFGMAEWRHSLRDLPPGDRIACALFQSVTPRTAGFSVVDMAETTPFGRFLTVVLMFVGGSPAGTAGGMKTTTLVVLLWTVWAIMKGRGETVVAGRTVGVRTVREALAIGLLGVFVVSAFLGLMLLAERPVALGAGGVSAEALLFETVSAFGTVGLSLGITGSLGAFSQCCLIAAMFIGRLGPLTVSLLIGRREEAPSLRYPEETVMVG